MLACWWVGWVCRLHGCSFPGAGVLLMVCEAGPKAKAGSLVGPSQSQGWCGLLVGGLCLQAMELQFPGAGCSPLVDETCPESRAGSLVGKPGDSGAGSAHCLWSCIPRSLVVGPWGVLGLVPVQWCVGPGPGPSAAQGHVQGRLWVQRLLRQSVSWWVGLCP